MPYEKKATSVEISLLICKNTNRAFTDKNQYFCAVKAQETFIQYQSLDEMPGVAARLLAAGGSLPVWLMHGDMGVGKTTLIKALCAVLGVESTVQSPTFSIVNEYGTVAGEAIYHFDCYRLKNEVEAYDIGAEEYLYSGYRCFVEWPEKIEALWPESYFKIQMTTQPNGSRQILAAAASLPFLATQ